MKKIVSLIVALCFVLSIVPCFAANPYTVMEESSNEEVTKVTVKKNDTYKNDFTLYASYSDDEYVYGVKSVKASEIVNGKEISFDTIYGANIELFAWDDNMKPIDDILADLDYSIVMEQLKKANDYWIGKNATIRTSTNPWDVAVFHTGNMQAYFMTGDELYRNYSQKWSEAHLWQSFRYPESSITNADNICCFRTYLDLYNIGVESADISYVENQIDTIVNSQSLAHWNWIDAFYMAAPTFVRMYELTGEEKYLDKMYKMIKYTAETLKCYDKEAGLWFRDAGFVGDISENGEKVYWSRGDGWVYAAFAQIIEELPDSYQHKDYFVEIFLEMSEALKNSQCEKGAWHESLLDQGFNPDCEESGTGFFTYGMLWGINNGYLDESEYLDCALRGWKWLSEVALQESGHIGYVQHIGAYPTKNKLTVSSTEDYAYANFVFAASEMAKYLGGMQGDILPYLQKKLLGNIEVYKDGAEYAIKNGEIVECSVNCEEITIPEKMYLYKYNDLYIVSEFITPFNRTETSLLDMLSDILDEGKFPERKYSDPDRIKIEVYESTTEETPTGSRGEGAIAAKAFSKPSFLIADKIELTEEDVKMSYVAEEHNGVQNALDGFLNTYMALQVLDEENPEYVEIDLGEKTEVMYIGLSFAGGNTRKSFFSVSVSDDGKNYTEIIPISYTSGTSNMIQYYKTGDINPRYIRIYGYGNSSVGAYTWFSVSELEIYKAAEEEILPINAVVPALDGVIEASFDVEASIISEPQNGPANINDGNEATYCVIYNTEKDSKQYVELDLGKVKDVKYLALMFRNGLARKTVFKIDVSDDGEIFTNVIPKSISTGETDGYEYYNIDEKIRYVRIYGYYNTFNTYWISFNEAKVYVKE